MFVTLALALASPTAAAPVAPAICTSSLPADRVAGRWTGSFAGTDWTFELTREGEAWVGRYQTSKVSIWRPLESVSVTGGCATFSVKSEPRLTFDLALEAAGESLSGEVAIAGHVSLPFAAKRVS